MLLDGWVGDTPYELAYNILRYSNTEREELIHKFDAVVSVINDEGMDAVVTSLLTTLHPYMAQEVLFHLAATLIEQHRPLPQGLVELVAARLRGEIKLHRNSKDKQTLRDGALRVAVERVASVFSLPKKNNPLKQHKDSACNVVLKAYNDQFTPLISIAVVEKSLTKGVGLF